jgi:hypothetical protein
MFLKSETKANVSTFGVFCWLWKTNFTYNVLFKYVEKTLPILDKGK